MPKPKQTNPVPEAPKAPETPKAAKPAKAPKPIVDKQAKAKAAEQAKATRAQAKADAKAARAAALAQAHDRLRQLREAEAARRHCLCDCGANTPTSFFVPGHDAKLVSRWLAEAQAKKAA